MSRPMAELCVSLSGGLQWIKIFLIRTNPAEFEKSSTKNNHALVLWYLPSSENSTRAIDPSSCCSMWQKSCYTPHESHLVSTAANGNGRSNLCALSSGVQQPSNGSDYEILCGTWQLCNVPENDLSVSNANKSRYNSRWTVRGWHRSLPQNA